MENRQTGKGEADSAYWVMEFVADQVKDISDLARDMQTEAHTHK